MRKKMKPIKLYIMQRLFPIIAHDYGLRIEADVSMPKAKKLVVAAMLFWANRDNVLQVIAGKSIAMQYVELVVTTKCSLHCKYCSNLMQFYDTEKGIPSYHTDLKVNINSIRRLLEFVNVIAEVKILGGEPLVYPQLGKLLSYLQGRKKIRGITVTTNGTIVPKDHVLTILQDKKFVVHISNYGKNSRHINELKDKLDEYSIRYKELFCDGDWIDFGGIECRHRNKQEQQRQFNKCKINCRSLLNGRLYSCFRSTHLMDLQVVKDCPDDYVELMNMELSDEDVKRGLERVLFGNHVLVACNYCDLGIEPVRYVKPGEQEERKKEMGE